MTWGGGIIYMNMMKGENKMKKTMMFAFMLLACLLVMPNVYAATEYPTVENITNENTLKEGKVTVTGSGTDAITITVENAKFKLLSEGEQGENRPDNYAWAGLRFTMPENATNVKIGGQQETPQTNKFDEYFGFNVQELKEAAQKKENFSKSWDLTWGSSNENKVTITLVVKPESTTLIKKEDTTEEWNETNYLAESKQVKLEVHVVKTNGEAGEEYTEYYYHDKGAKLTQKDLLAKLGVSSKYALKGIYGSDAKTAFDFSKELNDNTKIYVYYVEKAKETSSQAADEENPSTSDSLLIYVSLGVVALVTALGTGLYLRRN